MFNIHQSSEPPNFYLMVVLQRTPIACTWREAATLIACTWRVAATLAAFS